MTVVLIAMFSLGSLCHSKGVQGSTTLDSDTTILLTKDTLLIVGQQPAICRLQLPLSFEKSYDDSHSAFLIFHHPVVIKAPDGVYEVYVTHQKPDIGSLTYKSSEFTGLLDLYTLTEPDAKNYLVININKTLKIAFNKSELNEIYVTIIFRGNILPGGTNSDQTGKLTIRGLSIFQKENE